MSQLSLSLKSSQQLIGDRWHTSVWSTVPRLCLHEKGYGEDEYVVRDVDITKGEVSK